MAHLGLVDRQGQRAVIAQLQKGIGLEYCAARIGPGFGLAAAAAKADAERDTAAGKRHDTQKIAP